MESMLEHQSPLTWEQLRELQQISTPSIANAIETFKVRPRNAGVSDGSIRPQFPELGPIVGFAATARIRSKTEPAKGHSITRWTAIQHLLQLPEPRILVVEDVDAEEDRLGALWGEVQSNTFKRLGCVGTITNGGVPTSMRLGRWAFSCIHRGWSHRTRTCITSRSDVR
jgi:regulator of RNase E activity RraA